MSNVHRLNPDGEDRPANRSNTSGSESDDEGRQGFYVGGSERSGQQVLGPNRGDRQAQLFDAIRRAGAEQMRPEQEQALGRGQQPAGNAQAGTGFRLGGHGMASEAVGTSNPAAGRNAAAQRPQQVVRMIIWRNGFSIDDGPLRPFDDPQNREFLQAVMTKRVPPELYLLHPGRDVDLRIERRTDDYIPPKPKPFSGAGHRLGSHVPEVVGSSSSRNVEVVDLEPPASPLKTPEESSVQKAQQDVQLDEQQPVTRIQVRFPDLPQPVVGRFNHAHTVDQLRTFIVTVQPSLAYRPFHLVTVYPRKVIEDESGSLAEAGLLNSAVTIKFEQ